MNHFFHVLTIVAVAVHAVVGCRIHHAHAGGSASDASAAMEAACPCERHGHSHQDEPAEPHGNHGTCDEGRCMFLRPEKAGGKQLLSDVDGLPRLVSLATPPQAGQSRTATLGPSRPGPLIPRHLLLQVFLI